MILKMYSMSYKVTSIPLCGCGPLWECGRHHPALPQVLVLNECSWEIATHLSVKDSVRMMHKLSPPQQFFSVVCVPFPDRISLQAFTSIIPQEFTPDSPPLDICATLHWECLSTPESLSLSSLALATHRKIRHWLVLTVICPEKTLGRPQWWEFPESRHCLLTSVFRVTTTESGLNSVYL